MEKGKSGKKLEKKNEKDKNLQKTDAIFRSFAVPPLKEEQKQQFEHESEELLRQMFEQNDDALEKFKELADKKYEFATMKLGNAKDAEWSDAKNGYSADDFIEAVDIKIVDAIYNKAAKVVKNKSKPKKSGVTTKKVKKAKKRVAKLQKRNAKLQKKLKKLTKKLKKLKK